MWAVKDIFISVVRAIKVSNGDYGSFNSIYILQFQARLLDPQSKAIVIDPPLP